MLHMQDDAKKDVGVEYCVVIDLLCPNIVFVVRWISNKSLPLGTMVEEIQIHSSTPLCSALRGTFKIPKIKKKKSKTMKGYIAIKVTLT